MLIFRTTRPLGDSPPGHVPHAGTVSPIWGWYETVVRGLGSVGEREHDVAKVLRTSDVERRLARVVVRCRAFPTRDEHAHDRQGVLVGGNVERRVADVVADIDERLAVQ